MALTRSQAATAVGARSGRALVQVGLTTADTTTNLKEPLDDTFVALGVPYASVASATVEDSDLHFLLAVAEVFVLRRALQEAIGFSDVAATQLGVSKRKSQIVANLKDALARAEQQPAVYRVAGLAPAMTSGYYLIDSIEPEAVL